MVKKREPKDKHERVKTGTLRLSLSSSRTLHTSPSRFHPIRLKPDGGQVD